MPTINDVPVNDLIEQVAKDLEEFDIICPPEWASYVKTGIHKERPPVRDDWWHVRCAAVLRSVRKLQCVGVGKLRTKYGGRQRRGHKTERFAKGSGNILRKVLQQLEKAGLVKQAEKGTHKGRVITPKGISILDKAAVKLYKSAKKQSVQPKPTAPKTAEQPVKPASEPQKLIDPKKGYIVGANNKVASEYFFYLIIEQK